MGNIIYNLYINIKREIFTGYIKLCTPTLFTYESSSFTSLERLDTMKDFPSMNCFKCICCSGTTTMSKRVASALILANRFKIFYLEEGGGEVVP
jgi:hypothetical protein